MTSICGACVGSNMNTRTSHHRPLTQDAGFGRAVRAWKTCARLYQRQSQRLQHQAALASQASTTTTTQQLEKLCNWCKSKGVSTDKVTSSSSLQNGRGILVAAKDIAAGEAVLSVNDDVWVSTAAVRKSSIGKAVEGLEPWLQIALFLVAARASSSELAPYISTMPDRPSTPLFWSEEQLRLLQGSQMLSSLEGYRTFFEMKYSELFGPQGLLAGQEAIFPSATFTYQNFMAAVATVRSRSHAPLEGAALSLVPLADAVSHRRQGNTVWKARGAGLFGRGQTLVVEATRPIRKGEELSMDYAPDKLDGTVLLDFGVMDSTEARPGYVLSLSLDASDRLLDDKMDLVENTPALAPSMQFPLTPTTTPSDTMMGFLRLSNLKGADVFLLEPVFSAEAWSFMCEPVSEDNEKTVCSSMAAGAQAVLSGYASTIDADLALLRSGTLQPGSPEESAVRVRLGEQEALDATQQWFEERATTLKRLAYYQERRLRKLGLIDDEGRTTYDSFFQDGIA